MIQRAALGISSKAVFYTTYYMVDKYITEPLLDSFADHDVIAEQDGSYSIMLICVGSSTKTDY